MYQQFDHRNDRTVTPDPRPVRRARKKKPLARQLTALALSAVLFGGIAGGTSYAVSNGLGGDTAATSSLTAVSTAAYTGSGQSLDVTTVASTGLASVVSVTNISVQEVQDYFGMFGPGGRGQIQTQETTSCGSGVIVYSDDNALYLVTNYHVVEGATTLSVTFVDDETAEAQLCGYDADRDIAVLKVSVSGLSSSTLSQIAVATVGDSDSLTVGQQVVAIGNALGYGQSVTTGIVSAVDRTVTTDTAEESYIQTDAAINPGNSGGALFNMNGELVGINTAKISTTGVEGMGYAIPITEVAQLIQSFIQQS